jgi:serine phosphatase RsbU (regulator of sigma subunit)
MPCGEDHLNLLIGDVSGHGIGSALVANRIYTEMVTQLRAAMPLGDMLQHMNRFVIENMGISGFFSPQRWLVSTWVAGECSLQVAVIHQRWS